MKRLIEEKITEISYFFDDISIAESLRNAYKLLRHSSNTNVKVFKK